MHVCDRVLIGGEWVRAAHGTYPVIDPATEEAIGAAPDASAEQATQAARAARAAFADWSGRDAAERGALLRRGAEAFRERMGDLVDLTIAETGAVRPVAEAQQVGAVYQRLLRYAELAAAIDEQGVAPREIAPHLGGGLAAGLVRQEPVGVVACITPFNFPMTNCAGKIGPALACGNTVVVKPAPVDPLGVSELCGILAEALPPGVVSFVNGARPEVGAALSTSPDVDMISFTGSTQVGAAIREASAAQMKRTLLELGGKSANILFADADRARAVRSASSVWAFHSGQICIAGTRLLIEETVYEDVCAALVETASRIRIGDPREDGVVMGPLVSAEHRECVERWVARGLEEGATLACGGRRPPRPERGWYYEPTLLTGARNDMAVAREEIFGPVIVAIPFRDEEEAIAIANDSDYGLYGYVWSGDTARALRVARRLRTGTVQINGAPPHPDAPFGGFKRSGIGRDGGRYALEAYSELKYIGWRTP